MPSRDEFPTVFAALRSVLAPYAADLVVRVDESDSYSLDAPASPSRPDGMFFGATTIKKRYVSYHLMPVYIYPDLLEGASDGLRKRMQGKSCFNFVRLDELLVAELAALTEAGYRRYGREGLTPIARERMEALE